MKLKFIKNKIKALFIVFITALIFANNSYALEIEAQQVGNNKIYSINLTGEILKGDYNKLINVIKTKKYLPFNITIKSPGGSVNEAIKIAQFIRESLISVTARDFCYSSCFYIWISSIERNIVDKSLFKENKSMDEIMNAKVIGLHRPYFDKQYFSTLSMSEAELKYKELEARVRSFLKDLNVHEKWIDEMMMHSSENVRLVTRREVELEFGYTSHTFEEWILAKCPIDDKDLLFGKAAFYEMAMGGRSVVIDEHPKGELIKTYMKYSSCKEEAIKSSQLQTINKGAVPDN